jgi:hypothetical protein
MGGVGGFLRSLPVAGSLRCLPECCSCFSRGFSHFGRGDFSMESLHRCLWCLCLDFGRRSLVGFSSFCRGLDLCGLALARPPLSVRIGCGFAWGVRMSGGRLGHLGHGVCSPWAGPGQGICGTCAGPGLGDGALARPPLSVRIGCGCAWSDHVSVGLCCRSGRVAA